MLKRVVKNAPKAPTSAIRHRRLFAQVKEIEIFIDGTSHMVDSRMTIFQACHTAGVVIPRFCYHEKLSIAGNCRMCLVEVEKAPKPVASCTAQVAPGMRVLTKSEKTRVARGGVMEFLLANHPLDCPVCDQGGECDLQDISTSYGYDTGRIKEYKRAVEDKNLGPIISTHMNRCIHCTRCVRFSEEVLGSFDLGTVGRGKATEISTYVEKMIGNELSGNLADLCPVGALNHGPIAYISRPWELKSTNSIDLMEAILPRVEFNYRGPEIMRILPKIHEEVNEEWISDKSRYSYDGLKRQRLSYPLRRNKDTGQFEEITWGEALSSVAQKLAQVNQPEKDLVGLLGQFSSVEAATAFNDLFSRLNCSSILHDNYPIKGFQRSDYLFNRSIAEIESLDILVLIGSNLKLESPVLNARVLSAVRHKGLKVYKIGAPDDLGYKFVQLGNSTSVLSDIMDGNHAFVNKLKKAKNVHFAISSTLGEEVEELDAIYKSLQKFVGGLNKPADNSVAQQQNLEQGQEQTPKSAPGYYTVGVLNNFPGPISGYEVGVNFASINEVEAPKFIYNLGNDNPKLLDNLYNKVQGKCFTVYQGTQGDAGAAYADVILPAAAWTECNSTYVSMEGRVQIARRVVPPPGLAREDWQIIRALSEEVSVSLPYDSAEELRYRMAELGPHLLKYDHIEPYSVLQNYSEAEKIQFDNYMLGSSIDNYYKTDAISRSSVVMAKCSAAYNPSKMSNFLKKTYT